MQTVSTLSPASLVPVHQDSSLEVVEQFVTVKLLLSCEKKVFLYVEYARGVNKCLLLF